MSFEISVVPTTVAAELTTDLEAALAAYQGSLGVSEKSSASPGGDWSTEIRKYAGDPYALLKIQSLAQFAEQKTISVGSITYTTSVVSVEPNQIVLSACVDNSAARLFVDGVEVDPAKPNGSRFLQTVTLYKNAQSETGWLVSEVTPSGNSC